MKSAIMIILTALLAILPFTACEPIADYPNPLTGTKWICEIPDGYYYLQFTNERYGLMATMLEGSLLEDSNMQFAYGVKGDSVHISLTRHTELKGVFGNGKMKIGILTYKILR